MGASDKEEAPRELQLPGTAAQQEAPVDTRKSSASVPHPRKTPKTAERSCDGCGTKHPRRDLSEVIESLTFFEGDLLCRGCISGSDAETL